MTRTGSEVLELLARNRDRIRSLGVRSLALFGSSVRDEATPASDVDLLVEFDNKTFDNYMDLKFFLEDLLGRPVDLVLRSAVKPRLREPILAEAVRAPGL